MADPSDQWAMKLAELTDNKKKKTPETRQQIRDTEWVELNGRGRQWRGRESNGVDAPQRPRDPDFDADDIPLRCTIYRDVQRSRLNRKII
jgi:hypothetical protein